jgi:dephospho-CoA kinase
VAEPAPQDGLSDGRADSAAVGRFRVPFVGLTGGLGSGKSTALAALERLGAATISTDAVVHALYESAAVIDAVVDRWGPEVLGQDGGAVDRGAIARRVFGEPSEREWLEGLLWPLVGERVWAFRTEQEAADPAPKAAVVETPLLFEAGMDGMYDATIAVIAEEEVRRARAAARGHEAVDERAARQLTQDEKAQRATFVVRNDGTEADLEAALSSVLGKLVAPR